MVNLDRIFAKCIRGKNHGAAKRSPSVRLTPGESCKIIVSPWFGVAALRNPVTITSGLHPLELKKESFQ